MLSFCSLSSPPTPLWWHLIVLAKSSLNSPLWISDFTVGEAQRARLTCFRVSLCGQRLLQLCTLGLLLLDRDMKPIESVVCICSAQGVGLLGCGLVGSRCITVGVT